MNILYLDLFAGISGDMTLGALLDLGIESEYLIQELAKLNIKEEYDLEVTKSLKNGISGTNVDVILRDVSNSNNIKTTKDGERNLYKIEELIDESELNEKVKSMSKKIFTILAESEAKVHGKSIDKVYFHEKRATDCIVDIVGTAICIDRLGVDKIISSPLHVGTGFIECRHGLLPVPVPATLEILVKKNIPYYSRGIEGERVTPTGASIVAAIVDEFGEIPSMTGEKIGYGIGDRESEIPSLVRMIYGKETII